MQNPDDTTVRAIVLELLAGGAKTARATLLHEVARRHGIDPRQRKLRAQVAHAIRTLESEGRLTDGGPEVWLAPSDGPAER